MPGKKCPLVKTIRSIPFYYQIKKIQFPAVNNVRRSVPQHNTSKVCEKMAAVTHPSSVRVSMGFADSELLKNMKN
jgi:hypothetical protein